jgi:hypothetical protein
MRVSDAPFDWELRGRCGLAYSSQERTVAWPIKIGDDPTQMRC